MEASHVPQLCWGRLKRLRTSIFDSFDKNYPVSTRCQTLHNGRQNQIYISSKLLVTGEDKLLYNNNNFKNQMQNYNSNKY